jgi:hypothetical protein
MLLAWSLGGGAPPMAGASFMRSPHCHRKCIPYALGGEGASLAQRLCIHLSLLIYRNV